MTRYLLTLVLMFLLIAFSFSQPSLVTDINPGTSFGIWNSKAANFNNKIYFIGNDPSNGEELWVSDGTELGTYMVKDIYPGTNFPGVTRFFLNFNGNLYFEGVGENVNKEIWRTDGTEVGTVQHYDGCPGDCSSLNFIESPYMVVNGDSVFFALNVLGQTELYYTDGTTA